MSTKPQIDDIIGGALFDFVGHLCSTPEFADRINELRHELDQWAQDRQLELLEADVLHWDVNREHLKGS